MKDIRDLILDNVDNSLSDFANKCGITRMTLFNVLNIKNKPTLKTIKKICNFCKANYKDFYKK